MRKYSVNESMQLLLRRGEMSMKPSETKMGRGPVGSFEVQRQSERANKASRRLGALGCGTEHQVLVDIAKSVDLADEMQYLLELDAGGV
jgi:hypothetical protein